MTAGLTYTGRALLAAIVAHLFAFELELRLRDRYPVARCPKTEYRVLHRRGKIVYDTIPAPACLPEPPRHP